MIYHKTSPTERRDSEFKVSGQETSFFSLNHPLVTILDLLRLVALSLTDIIFSSHNFHPTQTQRFPLCTGLSSDLNEVIIKKNKIKNCFISINT